MSEEFQKKAFEPFAQEGQSARTKYAGTGLGLAIAKKLIELQGGTLFFESIQGKGTKFILRIPFEISAEEQEKNLICIRTVQWKEFRFCWWKTMS